MKTIYIVFNKPNKLLNNFYPIFYKIKIYRIYKQIHILNLDLKIIRQSDFYDEPKIN